MISDGDWVHIHSYYFDEHDNRLRLSLHERVSTDSEGIANCLGLTQRLKLNYKI